MQVHSQNDAQIFAVNGDSLAPIFECIVNTVINMCVFDSFNILVRSFVNCY